MSIDVGIGWVEIDTPILVATGIGREPGQPTKVVIRFGLPTTELVYDAEEARQLVRDLIRAIAAADAENHRRKQSCE